MWVLGLQVKKIQFVFQVNLHEYISFNHDTYKNLKEEKLKMVLKFNLPGTIFAISVHRFP
jgi:hypothetical protein